MWRLIHSHVLCLFVYNVCLYEWMFANQDSFYIILKIYGNLNSLVVNYMNRSKEWITENNVFKIMLQNTEKNTRKNLSFDDEKLIPICPLNQTEKTHLPRGVPFINSNSHH